MPSLVCHHLSSSWPSGEPALTDLSVAFPAGRTSLIGRNGVGTSTLLRILAGALSAKGVPSPVRRPSATSPASWLGWRPYGEQPFGDERFRATSPPCCWQSLLRSCLILDELTNILDLDSVRQLTAALSNYQAALLVASHDEQLLVDLSRGRRLDLGGAGSTCVWGVICRAIRFSGADVADLLAVVLVNRDTCHRGIVRSSRNVFDP
jgi:energy-coupling factor transporter ATP-binding protein EcfA2